MQKPGHEAGAGDQAVRLAFPEPADKFVAGTKDKSLPEGRRGADIDRHFRERAPDGGQVFQRDTEQDNPVLESSILDHGREVLQAGKFAQVQIEPDGGVLGGQAQQVRHGHGLALFPGCQTVAGNIGHA